MAHLQVHQQSGSYAAGQAKPNANCNETIAQLGLGLITAAVLLDAFAFLVDVLAGLRIVNGVPLEEVGFEYGSTLSRVSNLALPVAVLIGGSAFLWWFQCAYRARSIAQSTTFKPIWALIGWLIPGLNVVRPPQIMSELTRRSSLVGLWWALWAVGALIHVALRFVTPTGQRGWVYWQTASFVADMALLASLAITFALIDKVTQANPRRPTVDGSRI